MDTDRPDEELPNAIRAIRLHRGLSQQNLADQVGTSQSQIDRLERGHRRLTVQWLGRLAHALKVRPTELYDWDIRQVPQYLPAAARAVSYSSDAGNLSDSVVPLFSTIPHPSRSDMFILPNVVIGHIHRPPGCTELMTVFAFHNPQSLMSPRWKQGELVFVAENFVPRMGEPSLLLFKPEANFGLRAAMFCMSSIAPAVTDEELTERVVTTFYDAPPVRSSETSVFSINAIASRLAVIDWPQLLGA